MIENQKIRILWLTDIHFSGSYNTITNKKFHRYIAKFVVRATEEHEKTPINYILLSGDLAQMGIEKDYQSFKNLVLDKLLTAFKETGLKMPKVITVPGNHDVKWDKSKFLKKYIDYIDVDNRKSIDRPDYLETAEVNFRLLFEDYTKFVTDEANGIFGECYTFPKSERLLISKEYRESRLFGHIIDEANKVIFVLLNTAWYSLGENFNSLFIDYIKLFYDLKDVTEANLMTWLKTKDILTEYNTQITGIHLLKQEELKKYFRDYPDYMVITCHHHSRNWLEWTESYKYNESGSPVTTPFHELTQNSDVVLTGHEHVPINVECERLLNNILHLKGGCFLEYNQIERLPEDKKLPENKLNFANNWFSILDIDTSLKSIYQEKLYYEYNNDTWLSYKKGEPFVTAERVDYILTETRKKAVLKAFKNNLAISLPAYLNAYFSEGNQVESIEIFYQQKDKKYDLCLIKKGGVFEFCIFVHKPELYSSYFRSQPFFDELIEKVKQRPSIETVRFVMLDLFVDGDTKKLYDQKDPNDDQKFDRSVIFGKVVKVADNLFDVFRHDFFMHWEKLAKKNNLKADSHFKPFAKLKFINQIIPYWVSERFWM